jgi:hypothetical protein
MVDWQLIAPRISVFQDWLFSLSMQQQSVLVLACRGPDGIAKFHPTKLITTRYRATVLKAAHRGRPMKVDEINGGGSFMTLAGFENVVNWRHLQDEFFDHADILPHHYYMHLMHGAEIAGYKHPEPLFRARWLEFYDRCCEELHIRPETCEDMDERLNDWNKEHWDEY